uniref:Uncharacterized protein n=1 Tax=Brassica oleracea var. oleracea TaxID=109376 RepID=A0A0D3AGD5_BRAOL
MQLGTHRHGTAGLAGSFVMPTMLLQKVPPRTGVMFLRLLWPKLWRSKRQSPLQSLHMSVAFVSTPTLKTSFRS